MDELDKSILKELQSNGKITIKELASRLNMSSTPIFERIKKMEKSGVIKRYSAILDRNKLELGLLAYCSVNLNSHRADYLRKFEDDILHFSEVIDCYHVAGTFDYLLKVLVKDMSAYQDFVANKLASLENIGKVQSSFVMSEIKHSVSLPL